MEGDRLGGYRWVRGACSSRAEKAEEQPDDGPEDQQHDENLERAAAHWKVESAAPTCLKHLSPPARFTGIIAHMLFLLLASLLL